MILNLPQTPTHMKANVWTFKHRAAIEAVEELFKTTGKPENIPWKKSIF
jgi:hypothetical protein